MTALGLGAAYLIGAIPVGVIVARLGAGVDIRRAGSGNIGATNVLRTLGRGPAIVTLAGDVLKGAVAVIVARALAQEAWAPAGAVLAIAGNCWPVFLRFRGGKGMATGLGAFLTLSPWVVLPAALVWLGVVGATRLVSLGSVLAVAILPAGALWLGYGHGVTAAAALAALIIVARHHANIARLARGAEPRLGDRAGRA